MRPYYHDDAVTIYHGDCREILAGLAPASVDLVLMDPPYGHNYRSKDLAYRRKAALGLIPSGAPLPEARPIANDGPDAGPMVRWVFGEAARLLKPGGCCCCCCGGGGPDPQFARWSLWMAEVLNFKQAVVWDKGGLGMGWHYRRSYEFVLVGNKPGAPVKWHGGHSTPNIFRAPGVRSRAADHPSPKPPALMEHFVGLHSDPGDLVLDPFMGGGPTLVAAKRMGRRAIGIDVDERYCEMAAKRVAQEAII
jgi:DNA modification methylase